MITRDDIEAFEDRAPDWQSHLMGAARYHATKSKDSTKVGALLVGPNNETLLTAFNGPPMGVRDLPERRDTRPEKYLWVSHAEANLIAFAARRGIQTEGLSVYVTHMCCANCAKTLIQAGIRRVFVGDGVTAMPAAEFDVARIMFREAGVSVQTVP